MMPYNILTSIQYDFAKYGTSPITLGASGAIYAILLAYGLTWPNREVLLYFLFPIKMKYLVIIFGLIEFFGTISSAQGGGGNISHIGHLGGLASGFFYIMYKLKISSVTKAEDKKKAGVVKRYLKQSRLKKKQEEIDLRIKQHHVGLIYYRTIVITNYNLVSCCFNKIT